MASNPEISESLTMSENGGYPRDEESESKINNYEAGKFDAKPDNRVNCLMTCDSS